MRNRFTSDIQYRYYNGPPFPEAYGESVDEQRFGLFFGINGKLHIYKNIFLNTDISKIYYPTGIRKKKPKGR